ncbi:hypothetical protein [Glaciecola sp. 1036]|uniref:hypothetical protein n=1 Tax=Alteromonadaceae TaxID=72275 RepID=UPI003CFE286C
MEAVVIIVTLLFVLTTGLLVFCLTEPKGKNTRYARRHSNVATIEKSEKSEKLSNDLEIDKNVKEVA